MFLYMNLIFHPSGLRCTDLFPILRNEYCPHSMGGKTPHLEGEGWVELIIFQLNNFDSCTRQISASFGIFNIFINLKQVLKDRGLLLKSNKQICAFIKKNVTVDVNEHEQMISFHGYFVFLLIDHTD